MTVNLSDKLKSLRKSKQISQEKLAQYLHVSFQAVSKWETGVAYPEISLLPQIARFFGITVDELLQIETCDEDALYREYEKRAEEAFRNGQYSDHLSIWLDAYEKLPNSLPVKEKLMSAYYDADKLRYRDEIIEIGNEIYHSDASMHLKGQAIHQLATTYAACGSSELAEKWANRSVSLFHSQDIISTEIHDGEALIHSVRFCTYWFFRHLFYMAARIDRSENQMFDAKYKQNVYRSVAQLYTCLYKDDDMDFESIRIGYLMHRRIAELEADLSGSEACVRSHLERAQKLACQSANVKEHALTHPMLCGWLVEDAPTDHLQVVRQMSSDLKAESFEAYRTAEWFVKIEKELHDRLK